LRSKRGSFSFRLFYVSVILILLFVVTSVLANSYFVRSIILNTFKERVLLFMNCIAKVVESGEDIGKIRYYAESFFYRDELYKLSLYSKDTDRLVLEIRGDADFDETTIPDISAYRGDGDYFQIKGGNYLTLIRGVTFTMPDGGKESGFFVLNLNISRIFMSGGAIYKYRVIISLIIITLFILLIYIVTRLMTRPFVLLLKRIEGISKGDIRQINQEEFGYEEFDAILANFKNLLGFLDSTRENLIFSEKRLKTLLEKSRDIILMLDRNFKIEYASSTFLDLTGVDIFKSENRLSLSEFVSVEERSRLLPVYRKVLRGITVNDLEIKISDRQSNDKFLLTTWIAVDDEAGDGSKIILLARDVTEYKKIENELRKRTEALETILFSLSHDLKSPVFTLKGMALLFRNKYYDGLDEQGRHFIDRINENVVRMERMISHMLDISRYERQVFRTEDVNLRDVIQLIIDDMKSYIEECDAEIIVEGSFPVIKGDKDKLYIAFKNLFENSFKYRNTSKKLRISIKSVENSQKVELIFEDNGIGIESRYLDRLFRPFSRAVSQAENIPQGYGIGLAIVKGILDAHKADIKVESLYGEWTRFRIFFDRINIS